MSFESLRKLQKIMLFMIIICLPLNNIPKTVALPGLGGNLSNYFVLAAILLLLYEYFKFKFEVNRKVIKFFAVFIIWQSICLIIGLVTYEHNQLLTLEQIPQLSVILYFLDKFEIYLNELIAIKFWLFLRFMKVILFTNNIIFFITLYIWHLYRNNFDKAFNDVRNAVMCLVIIMGAYSFIELLWLKLGLNFAKEFLTNINPLLYEPKTSHGWWPPLLWKNQLRSICTEPSFFGIISVFCLPFLWSLLFERKNKILSIILIFYFTLMIAATNARTAIILAIAEIIIIGAFLLLRKNMLKNLLVIVLVSVLAFGANLINFRNYINENNNIKITDSVGEKQNKNIALNKNIKEQKSNNKSANNVLKSGINAIEKNKKTNTETAKNYVEKNILSLLNVNSRSNNARLASLVANLNVIQKHPLFGVGTGLKDSYIYDNLPEFAKNNNEVKNWGKYMQKEGVMRSGYPVLNKIVDIMIQNGLIGLLIYFFPLVFLCKKLLKYKKLILNDNSTVCLITVMIALLGAMMSSGTLIICNGIVWGLLFCKVSSIEKL